MLRSLLFCLLSTLSYFPPAQADNFEFPPDSGTGLVFQVGDLMTAQWNSSYSFLTILLWNSFVDPNGQSAIYKISGNRLALQQFPLSTRLLNCILLTRAPAVHLQNTGSHRFVLGGNVGLSQGSTFALRALETDSEGNESGNFFRSSNFQIIESSNASTTTVPTTLPASIATAVSRASASTLVETLTEMTGSASTTLATTTLRPEVITVVTKPNTSTPAPTDLNSANGSRALDSTQTPVPTTAPGLAPYSIGLGVGLGAGIPIAAVFASLVFFRFRERPDSQVCNELDIGDGPKSIIPKEAIEKG